jgi:GDPmannose 4,6-dehydratase
MKCALVCGVTGQDGAYLARLLLSEGYHVVGTARHGRKVNSRNLEALGISGRVRVVCLDYGDHEQVRSLVAELAPDEIYFLAGRSSVRASFVEPVATITESTAYIATILESLRARRGETRLYYAGSSECFGDLTAGSVATESTAFAPCSPYGMAKAAAHGLVAAYRRTFGVYAATGLLFNHESPLRPETFVTQKIVRSAARIARGSKEKLSLGDVNVCRDWGWAPDYVVAMWKMLQLEAPEDFIIATGRTVPLVYFLERAFGHFGLEWKRHVELDTSLQRPSELRESRASPIKARMLLEWEPTLDVDGVVVEMCAAAQEAVVSEFS